MRSVLHTIHLLEIGYFIQVAYYYSISIYLAYRNPGFEGTDRKALQSS